MVNEDFLRQLARQISKNVVNSTATQTSENLAIFCDGVSNNLKTEVLAAYPNIRILENSHTEDLSQIRTVLLVAPSLDIASKIALLQTDNSIVDLIVRALYTGKRVVAVVEGLLTVSKDRSESA
ncbi:MAG: hypothetical protein JNN15_18985, partial [Blastocatellia bacterium]|nr:hypothetical protein [Blastocatellia bacterium]